VIYLAVKRMLPKNRLRDRRLKRLKIYVGSSHPHHAQNPQPLNLET
jgi:large subunit ribosomal protein L13